MHSLLQDAFTAPGLRAHVEGHKRGCKGCVSTPCWILRVGRGSKVPHSPHSHAPCRDGRTGAGADACKAGTRVARKLEVSVPSLLVWGFVGSSQPRGRSSVPSLEDECAPRNALCCQNNFVNDGMTSCWFPPRHAILHRGHKVATAWQQRHAHPAGQKTQAPRPTTQATQHHTRRAHTHPRV